MDPSFWGLTDSLCRGVEQRFPDSDPKAIWTFYKAAKEWHDSIGCPRPKVTADGCLMPMQCHFETLFQDAHSVVLEVQQRLSLNLALPQAVMVMLFQKADANLLGDDWKRLPVLEVEEYPNVTGRVGTTGRKEDRLPSYAARIDWAYWKTQPAWRLLIAARLRQGVEPLLLPLEADNGKPEMLPRIGQCYQAAAGAIELGDLPGRKVDEEYLVRPVDFVRWCDSQGIEMVPQMRALLDDGAGNGGGDAGRIHRKDLAKQLLEEHGTGPSGDDSWARQRVSEAVKKGLVQVDTNGTMTEKDAQTLEERVRANPPKWRTQKDRW